MSEYTPAQIRTGNRRLLKLADILDVADALHRKRGEPGYDQERYTHPCGSPACALGHAYTDAAFRRAGMRDPRRTTPETDAEFFRVNVIDNFLLFGDDGCNNARTAKQAARYIRAFVERRALASATPKAVRA
jgi:hypothetical protein